MTTFIWISVVVLATLLAVVYGLLKMWEEKQQALEEAGDMYQVIDVNTGTVVAEFDTDWLAEAYIDDHYPELLYISLPEERFKAALKRIRQQ